MNVGPLFVIISSGRAPGKGIQCAKVGTVATAVVLDMCSTSNRFELAFMITSKDSP